MTSLTQKFVKTYGAANATTFKYTTMVTHKGTVIAFAMDDKRRIYYSVLDMERSDIESQLDVDHWDREPVELQFPKELSAVGYSAAGVRQMPTVILSGTEGLGEEIDQFLSTTARLTADSPFQVVSDNQHIYVFRQAKAHDAEGKVAKDSNQATLEFVDQTLLLDRFVYVSGELKNKLEVRYQRSRHKDLPASRKDALGHADLEKKEFYEPTQQLSFIRNMQEGRFSVLLIPTAIPDVQRWQIFAYNAKTQRMDSFNIERAADGLFNTRGTRYYTSPEPAYQNDVFERQPGTCPFTGQDLIPIVSREGYAESALALNGVSEYVKVEYSGQGNGDPDFSLTQSKDLTLEAWIQANSAESNPVQTLIAHSQYQVQYLTAIGTLKLSYVLGDRETNVAYQVAIEDGQFHHLAITVKATELTLYVDGQLVKPEGTTTAQVTAQSTVQASTLYFGCDNQQANLFKGVIDEVRVWNRAIASQNLIEDMNHRLVGNEPDLIGYWRFDEGAGTTLYDQTDYARHGQFITGNTASADIAKSWVKSQAPVGEHPGVRRSSFSFEGRTITAGCAALLYHQQEKAATGYNPEEEKPLKRSARIMFAVPTQDASIPSISVQIPEVRHSLNSLGLLIPQVFNRTETIESPLPHHITVLDFAINREGNLAQVPDTINLEELKIESINDALDDISQAESEVDRLNSTIQSHQNRIEQIEETIQNGSLCTAITQAGYNWVFFVGKQSGEIEINSNAATVHLSSVVGTLPGIDSTKVFGTDPAIEAIAHFGEREYYIFSGLKCHKYRINDGRDRYPIQPLGASPITEVFKPSTGTWSTLPDSVNEAYWQAWQNQVESSGIDAATNRQGDWDQASKRSFFDTYLFKGKLCAVVRKNRNFVTGVINTTIASVNLISELFPDFPETWLDNGNLDAAYTSETLDTILFFKGGEFVKYPISYSARNSIKAATGKDRMEPQVYESGLELEDWEHDLLSKLSLFRRELNLEIDKESRRLTAEFPSLNNQLSEAQQRLESAKQVSQIDPKIAMPSVLTDPTGLTVSGGILGFANTTHAPHLFETVNGRISLYFKGETTSAQENHFLAAYYNVLAGRATYGLPKEQPQAEFIARSTGAAFDNCEIEVSGESEATCTVTLKSPSLDIEEIWHQVPRQPQQFADVLNGAAQPTYVGQVTHHSTTETATKLSLEGRGQQTVAIGDVLLVGSQKTQARVARVFPPFRGAALVLDGKDDYIQLGAIETILPQGTPSGSSLSVAESFTAEAWVWVDEAALNQDSPVLGMDERAETKSLHLTIRQGKPHFGFFGGMNDLTSDYQLLPKTWYHIAWRYTRETGEQAIFINGRLDKTAMGRAPFMGRGPLYIGRWSSNPQRYFKGMIGEVRIWSEARPEADIQANLSRYLTGQDSGTNTLVGCWRFGQSPQGDTTARDYSARNRPCTVQGQPRLEQVQEKATQVEVVAPEIGPGASFEVGDSVYRLTYDYDANASTNRVMRSLSQGSLLFNVNPVTSQGAIFNGTASDIQKGLSGQWFTDTYGSALNFDKPAAGSGLQATNVVGLLHDPNDPKDEVGKFSTDADLTLEAWVKHVAFPKGTTRLIHHSSVDPSDPKAVPYTMGLRSYGLHQGHAGDLGSLYHLFVGVGDTFVQTAPMIQSVQWHHLAASFNQSYGLEFKRDRDQVNCGSDITLDLTDDLTIEATIRLADLDAPRGILTKGQIDDGTDQDCPYALYIDTEGRLVLAFEDKNHHNVFLTSPEEFGTIEAGKTYRIGVTRKKTTEKSGSGADFTIQELTDVYFFKQVPGSNPTYTKLNQSYTGTIGSSNGNLLIGKAFAKPEGANWPGGTCYFQGEISEVRLWNTALGQQDLGQPIKGREKGLVAWWQFEENDGAFTEDAKGQNHGTITGASWIKSTDPAASRIQVYVNGNPVVTTPWENDPLQPRPKYGPAQFHLGMSNKGDGSPVDAQEKPFVGEMDEIRIWRVARTEEQIQDNLFRRLIGDYQHLIAYYRFDEESQINPAPSAVKDSSGRGLDLAISTALGSKPFTISTAPISEETAQVRSALAQARSSFHAKHLSSTPTVQEYGDMQYDGDGNQIGVMKRCYSYIESGQWHLVTGYKVGDLELEWIGQAQYDPQIIGFIEGAPPVPSENLTIRIPDLGQGYENVSVIDLTEADNTTYTYSQTKEGGYDTAIRFKAGVGIKSETSAGIGISDQIANIESAIGIQGSLDISESWINEQQVAIGKTTNKLSRLGVQGDWEDQKRVQYPEMGRRYVPKNVGFALVQSETADVFAMRLKHPDPARRVTVALRMQPNPDIPKDWNIIIFPMNNRYCKQGTLDGRIGLKPDQKDYPNAKDYSPDRSYFKPIEAYALKNRIEKEQKELEAHYLSFNPTPTRSGGNGGLAVLKKTETSPTATTNLANDLPGLTSRNMFNTYVWTADGGLFAETQQFMETRQEVTAGEFSVSGMGGLFAELKFAVGKAAVVFEMEAMAGGHLNLTKTKSIESEKSFGVEVNLEVERDILIANEAQAKLVGRSALDAEGNRARCPGKVDGYRFMTFYLEPNEEHFKDFANKVVDRVWLEQSSDPNAAALRQALDKTSGTPWRVLHRVTYVSRVLPEIGTPNASSIDEQLRVANIDSNWELIKRLEPYVKTKTSDYGEFKAAVEEAIQQVLPELEPAKADILSYMSLYYQVFPVPPSV
ncbi:LamG-like jellyroll fold domain-containing protein [Leptolyngbya sp. CCNP1308]|uniref:LamG-like jellyroll fold domain-containing protein n=1 Tax=Leptolyngbya sp. CCNP1308 TaxID=3110255 RepID=UPI002B1F3F9F|nr:LamG-like jellyroll fold domain-containing protein [Leptolyngbya sp. CCNP1308]MEA5449222.1 LamG-like jellyroll fold domain-containing protein [Leptolyngbya sp. CCNP1308]